MSQKEIVIVGKNNTKAEVTGQNELKVQVSSMGSGSDLATETTLQAIETNTNGVARTPNIVRATGAGTIAPIVYDFSVANVGAANGTILGQTIKPSETLNFSAGALGNYYAANTITYNGTGTELVIIYNS